MSQTLDSKTAPVFAYRREQLEEMASDVLRIARELGASDAATEISEGQGLSVTVRKGEIETIEQNRDKIVGVTVMLGKNAATPARRTFRRQHCGPPSRPPTTSRASQPTMIAPAWQKKNCWRSTRETCSSITHG